jgi:hypothetical protein
MRNRDRDDGGDLRARLRGFAAIAGEDSPLYARLASAAVDSPVVLRILGEAPHRVPAPLNLFGAVHHLLLSGENGDLATHYPTVAGPDAEPVGDPAALFVEFCERHEARLTELVATRGVQTNEVLRSATLLPAFAAVAAVDRRPLSLIEIGPSAGLNLLFDRYRYDYAPGGATGPDDAPLTLRCEVRSGTPPIPRPLPQVADRVGVDLSPVDPTDPDAMAWARALVWPEHLDRMERLEAAMAIAARRRPPVVAGDAAEMLPDLLAAVPAHAVPLVFHSYALNQIPAAGRRRIDDALGAHSRRRAVHRVAVEMPEGSGERAAKISHTFYARGAAHPTVLGRAHFHGRWLSWD